MKSLSELYRIADKEKVQVDCFELRKRESLSVMDGDGRCYIAIDPLRLVSERDERQKLAHELGHCLTGSFYNKYASCDVRKKHENSADRWAIETVLPEEEMDRAAKDGYTEPWQLAEYFDMPEEFIKKAWCWYKHGTFDTE